LNVQPGRFVGKGNYIAGSFEHPAQPEGSFIDLNPADPKDSLGRFVYSSTSVDAAVESAQQASAGWRNLSLDERKIVLIRLRTILEAEREDLSSLVMRGNGKPLWAAQQEVDGLLRSLSLLLEDGLSFLRPTVLDARQARSDRRPRGVVGLITPHVEPLLTAGWQICSALLAGNTVVWKPSHQVSAVAQSFAECADRARLPRGVFNMVQGRRKPVGITLATHPALDALVCTGSRKMAMAVGGALAGRPELPVAFECGGKGSAIVLASCDLKQAVYEVMLGAFMASGQGHNCTGRVFVETGCYSQFLRTLADHVERVPVGPGWEPSVFMGPLIDGDAARAYQEFGAELERNGHRAVLPVQVESGAGNFVRPAIYEMNWKAKGASLEQEPPGPMLLLYEVQSLQEAAFLHNQLTTRASTSVFGGVEQLAGHELGVLLQTGMLNVNRATIHASLRLSMTRLGHGSNGCSGGMELLRFLTAPAATFVETRPFDEGRVLPGLRFEDLEPTVVKSC